jgi:uncharacterized protein (DUF1330 family)
MTAYAIVVRERTTDADALAQYREKAPLAREKHPVTPIAFYGLHEVLEGEPVEGVAILSFPTMAAARAWYSSPEYQAALPHRIQGSVSHVILVAGLDEIPEDLANG